eukprot:UN02314
MGQVDANSDGHLDIDEWTYVMNNIVSDNPKTYEGQLKSVFNKIDIDNDGKISTKELTTLMIALGENISENEIKAMVKEIDDNNDGNIDFKEFCSLMSQSTMHEDMEGEKKK